MTPHEYLAPRFVKFAPTDTPGAFVGFASTFGGKPDSYGDVVDRGAFLKSLAQHETARTRPAMLWAHDSHEPIGVWDSLAETDEGLEVRGRLTLEVARARDAYHLMKVGALALSIGFQIRPGGAKRNDGVRHLTDLELIEVSAVALPANTNARITAVKTAFENPRDLEAALRDACGLSARQAKRLLAGGWSAMVRDEPDADDAAIAALIRIIHA